MDAHALHVDSVALQERPLTDVDYLLVLDSCHDGFLHSSHVCHTFILYADSSG